MYNVYGLQPMIYRVKKGKDGMYFLEPRLDKFVVPDKIYGNYKSIAARVWNSYVLEKKSTGAMFTGHSGSGKTLVARLTCNIALDNNIPVIEVTELETSIELVSFLADLPERLVILFDEFSKNFENRLQDKMLTMLSDTSKNRIHLITENNANYINEYIRNRPERIKYHFDFSRIDQSVFDEYCSEFTIDHNFYLDLVAKYNSSTVFSLDHLKALISEHTMHPQDSLTDLLKVLNLSILSKPLMLYPISVESTTGTVEVELDQDKIQPIEVQRFDNQYNYFYVSIYITNSEMNGGMKMPRGVKVDKTMVRDIVEDLYIIDTPDNFTITFQKR